MADTDMMQAKALESIAMTLREIKAELASIRVAAQSIVRK